MLSWAGIHKLLLLSPSHSLNLLDCLSSLTCSWTQELGRALFVQTEQHLEATSSPSLLS